ncbi:MAG: CPBP family intramembrane metalloprotease [Labilithrix sp.]|nr:CPBP family intramembrane metalloprotease [Labilithrix sp.]
MSKTSTETERSRPTRGRVLLVVLANLFAVVVAVVVSTIAPRALRSSEGAAEIVRSGLVVGVHAALLLLAVRLGKLDRVRVGLAFSRGDLRGLAAGATLAVATVIATFAIAGALGKIHVSVAPRAEWPTKAMLGGKLFGTTVRSAFEEIAFRAGLVGVLGLAFRRGVSLGVPALLFGLAHAGNQGATPVAVANTAIAAVVLGGLFLLGRGGAPSLAACTAFHATWNFAIGSVLGGAVSGGAGATRLFTCVIDSPTWSGGAYGIEASPATTLVYGALAAWVLLRLSRRISPEAARAEG